MKYIALLRGINVGGNNVIKITDLKQSFEDKGFTEVTTYIQSGNVIFASSEKDTYALEKTIEQFLSQRFTYKSKVMVRSYPQMQKILESVPQTWNSGQDLRCYIAFVKAPTTAQEVMKETPIKEDIDFLKAGPGVVYMSTLLKGVAQSGINRLAGKKIYQEITIRNYATTQKLGELLR